MKYTATHKHLPTPAIIGASRDARWEGVTRRMCRGTSRPRSGAALQIDRIAVLTMQRKARTKRK